MNMTVRATYDKGVLRLRRLLPLAPQSEVLVTVDTSPSLAAGDCSAPVKVEWPDIAVRLSALYGATAFAENAVLAARSHERY